MIGRQGQWRAGPINRVIFQSDGTLMVPIFHYPSSIFYNTFLIPSQDQAFADLFQESFIRDERNNPHRARALSAQQMKNPLPMQSTNAVE
jgi:hypothetical protein